MDGRGQVGLGHVQKRVGVITGVPGGLSA
jgi:hypothetical protein